MSTTTTVTGPIETLEASALEGKYIRFTLLTSGTEIGTGDLVAASTKSYLLDASGDFSATLWVNGESGVESVYRIEVPGDNLTYEVIIPTSAGGGTISIEDLIENHQVSGSSPQQSSTLAQAQAYTDTLANNPDNNASFNVGNWVSALDVFQLGDDASFNTLDLTQAASSIVYSLALANKTGFRGVGAGSLDFGYYRDGFPVWYATASGLSISNDVRLASGPSVNEIETTITDDDTHLPTSGAVVDYVNKTTTSVTTTTYTLLSSDRTLLCDNSSGVTVTLLAAATAGDGFTVTIKNVGSAGVITIDADGTETIDGSLTATLTSQYDALKLACDGSNWHII